MTNGFSSVLTIISAANGFSYGAGDIVMQEYPATYGFLLKTLKTLFRLS